LPHPRNVLRIGESYPVEQETPAPWDKKDGDIPRGKPAVDPRGIRNLEPSEAKAGGMTR
jgi:hypothetical protein